MEENASEAARLKAQQMADDKFEELAAESSMMPTLCRKTVLFPTGENTFCLALGSAGIYGQEDKNGPIATFAPRPAAAIAFTGLLDLNTLRNLGRQIEMQVELLEARGDASDGE